MNSKVNPNSYYRTFNNIVGKMIVTFSLIIFLPNLVLSSSFVPYGAYDFLELLRHRFNINKNIKGYYIKDELEVEALIKTDIEINFCIKGVVNYEIIKATRDSYHITARDKESGILYELDNNIKYPKRVFKNEKEKANAKQALINSINDANDQDKRKLVYEFKYFDDRDTKQYLIQIIKNKNGDDTFRFNALSVLKWIVNNSDNKLLPDLIDILNSEKEKKHFIYKIIEIFAIFSDPSTVPYLEEIIATESDYNYFPVKTEATMVLNEIKKRTD